MATVELDDRTRARCRDGLRSRRAGLHALVVAVVALVVAALVPDLHHDWPSTIVLIGIGAFNVYAADYARQTWRVFAKVDADAFTRRMEARRATRARGTRRLLPGGDGPSFAISASIGAFVTVLVVPHIDGIRLNEWLLVLVSLTTLSACWALAVLSYALHYAQYDIAEPGFDFPGERTQAFSDYVYVSLAVATTLGATDVSITTVRMRQIMNFHIAVAFLFNSVIVALLVSILVR